VRCNDILNHLIFQGHLWPPQHHLDFVMTMPQRETLTEKQHFTYDTNSFIADFGGFLGLLLGFSFIDIYNFVIGFGMAGIRFVSFCPQCNTCNALVQKKLGNLATQGVGKPRTLAQGSAQREVDPEPDSEEVETLLLKPKIVVS
jgi:hypothetical protein